MTLQSEWNECGSETSIMACGLTVTNLDKNRINDFYHEGSYQNDSAQDLAGSDIRVQLRDYSSHEYAIRIQGYYWSGLSWKKYGTWYNPSALANFEGYGFDENTPYSQYWIAGEVDPSSKGETISRDPSFCVTPILYFNSSNSAVLGIGDCAEVRWVP